MDPGVSVSGGLAGPAEKLFRELPPEAANLTHALVERRLFEDSLEEALTIQRALLPAEPLRLPPIEVWCKYRPAGVVSGDFLDYFPIGNSSLLGLYVGDVVGKGMAAALYGALAMGTLLGINKGGETPARVLEFLNRRLFARSVVGRNCAVQYAVFDLKSGELRFGNAGLQPRPIHISKAETVELGEGGFPCGMFEDVRYDVYTTQLQPGDTVLFSTDGLIEAVNPANEPFGVERLLAVCDQNRNESSEVLLDRVFQAVDAFAANGAQRDDMTAAALRLT